MLNPSMILNLFDQTFSPSAKVKEKTQNGQPRTYKCFRLSIK